MKRTLGQRGFSLIELMVVVAIIGILAAIAIPNYQRFQAKSRQAEAKTQLSGLFTAEKAYFAEWNQYFGDFRDIGFAPEGNLRYLVGFGGAGNVSPADPNYTGASGVSAAATQFDSAAFCALSANCNNVSVCGALQAGNVSAGNTFTAEACGDIDGDATNDAWTLDETKTYALTTDDLNT